MERDMQNDYERFFNSKYCYIFDDDIDDFEIEEMRARFAGSGQIVKRATRKEKLDYINFLRTYAKDSPESLEEADMLEKQLG